LVEGGAPLPQEGPRSGFAWTWLPILAYVALIFTLSSQQNLAPPFHFSEGDKLAHTLEYGGLGMLLARGIRKRTRVKGPLAGGLAAVLVGVLIAAADEFWQSHVPGRNSNVLDWFADANGLVLAQLAFLAIRQE
jgi:VanZ family protein